MRNLPHIALLAGTLAVAGACSDLGAILDTPINLTAGEVNQLFGDIFGLFDSAGVSFDRVAVSSQLDRAANISASAACPGGGTAAFSGTSSSQVSQNVTITYTGCVTTHYTIDGSFTFTQSATSTTLSDAGTGDLKLKAADGRSGTCHVDFSVSKSLSGTGTAVTATGTICGVDASQVSVVAS